MCLGVDGKLHTNVFCPVNVSSQPLGTLPDMQTTEKVVEFLGRKHETPFFLAVGLHKPHIPHKFPAEFLSYHPLDSIKLAENSERPSKLPTVSWNPYKSLRKREDVAASDPGWPWGPMGDDMARLIKQGYYSAVTYMDSLVGEIVSHIDNNTLIVLFGDHGWSLGEHGEWTKMSNFEEVVRVPFILVPPANIGTPKIKDIDNIISLVDLFPSLVDLVGLPHLDPCEHGQSSSTLLCTEGKSFVPLLTGKVDNWTEVSFSQYPRPSIFPRWDSDLPKERDIRFMGYSVRWKSVGYSAGWRCTVWMGFRALPRPQADLSNIAGIELYNHDVDPKENNNVAKDKKKLVS